MINFKPTIALALCLSFVTFSAFGQALKTWQTPALKFSEGADNPHSYLCSDADGHLTTQVIGNDKKGWKLRLNHFSKDFQNLSSTDIPASVEDMDEIATLKIGGQLIRLQYKFKWGEGVTTVEAMYCKMDGSEPCKSLKLLEPPKKRNIEPPPTLKWAISPDSSKLLVAAERAIAGSGEITEKPQEIYVAVLGADGSLLWKKEMILPTSEAETKVVAWYVTNKGEALLLTELFDKTDVDKKKEIAERELGPSRSCFFKLAQTDKLPAEIPLREGPEQVSGCTLKWADNENFHCACFYSDQPRGNFNGFLWATYSPVSHKTTNEHKTAFDKELLGFFKGYNTEKDKPGIVSTFTFNQIHPMPGGGTVLLAGKDYDTYFGRFSGNSYDAGKRYIRGDIAIFELDGAGRIARKALFPRAAMFGFHDHERVNLNVNNIKGDAVTNPLRLMPEDELLFLHNGKIYVQYFASPKDLKKRDPEKAPTYDVAVRALGTLDASGNATITELPELDEPGKNDAPAPFPAAIALGDTKQCKVFRRGINAKLYYFDVYYLTD